MAASIDKLFYSGSYREVIARTVDLAEPSFDDINLHWVVGALSFVGRLDEVDQLLASHQWDALTATQQTEARFYQAIGMCRHSCYLEAAKLFFHNLRTSRHGDARQRFFVFQGLGFYAYFKGHYRQALSFAKRASDAALVARFTYGRALAEDLKAHCLVQNGSIRSGLKSLRQAHHFAQLLGSGGFAAATSISQKLYQAQHGILQDPESELLAVLKDCKAHNNYSEANIYLELVQQLLLRGKRQAADEMLNEACGLVYESPNRRQGALLNLRYASIAYLKGDYYQALNLLRCGREELNPDIDTPLTLQLLGLELDVRKKLGMPCETEERKREFALLRRRSRRYISWRLAHRMEEIGDQSLIRRGEDPLGDLMDLASHEPRTALPRIIASGYWGLVPRALGMAAQESCLFLDPIAGTLVLSDRGDVHVVTEGYTPAIRTFLQLLSHGPLSKEEIIVKLWGYSYHPERHDGLVYRLVSRTRQLFDRFSPWLQSYENHYCLDPSVVLRHGEHIGSGVDVIRHMIPEVADIPDLPEKAPAKTEELNARQLQLLNGLTQSDLVDTSDYSKQFSVSEATARRDLSALVALNLLARHGKARATKYSVTSNP